ncbi:uncharacterized protein [Euwallacea similis]|uniref:uncharacterized protein isoform X2 n=1 Tax=Euwallacea similis TaxID=1736056 RepID=UPI00344C7D81
MCQPFLEILCLNISETFLIMDVQNETEERYLEDYLKHTGWGLYYKFIIGLACACHLLQGLTFVTMSFAVSLSSCDELIIPEITSLSIFVCFLIGSSLGELMGNPLSDRYGRKKYLVYSLIGIFAASFVAAFSYNVYVMIGATLILGVGLEVNALQIKLLVVEILDKQHRGFWLMFCNMFYVLGYVITIVSVILFETQTIITLGGITFKQLTPWRTMFAACGGISLILACVSALIEESPRFYLLIGRNFLAHLLLKQLFAINNSSFADNFKIHEDHLNNLIQPYDLNYVEPTSHWEQMKSFLHRLCRSVKTATSTRYRKIATLLVLLKTPLIIIGILQLNICLSKLMVSSGSQSLEKFRGMDFIYPVLEPKLYALESNSSSLMCQKTEKNRIFYGSFTALASSLIPGHVLGMFVVDRLGRKFICCLLTASCSSLIIGFVQSKLIQLIAMGCTMASIGVVISTITLVNLEVFPTAIRSTSNALTNVPGLILSTFFVTLIVIDRQMFTIILGILYFCLAVFTCFLPEMKRKPMVE